MELLGIASGPPVLFPGPGVGAKAPPVGDWADPVAMVMGEVGDPVQNCHGWGGMMVACCEVVGEGGY